MKYLHSVYTLSAEINIIESDTNQTLIPLDKNKFICAADYFMVRKNIVQKLNLAQKLLPVGYTFKIYETYRSHEKQMNLWKKEVEKIKKEYPNWSIQQVYEKANDGIADPNKIGSGHQTGGAIDITLCFNDREVDMGTPYLTTDNPKTKTKTARLTPLQYYNRNLLQSVMHYAGFANYPLEWWHFSYGEHEWAILTHHKSTLYTAIKQPLRIKE